MNDNFEDRLNIYRKKLDFKQVEHIQLIDQILQSIHEGQTLADALGKPNYSSGGIESLTPDEQRISQDFALWFLNEAVQIFENQGETKAVEYIKDCLKKSGSGDKWILLRIIIILVISVCFFGWLFSK